MALVLTSTCFEVSIGGEGSLYRFTWSPGLADESTPSRVRSDLLGGGGGLAGDDDVVFVGAGLGALERDVELVHPQAEQLDVIDRGLLEGVEQGAVEQAVGGQVPQRGELVFDFGGLVLIVEDLTVFVGVGADLAFQAADSLLAEDGLELEGTAPDQDQRQ